MLNIAPTSEIHRSPVGMKAWPAAIVGSIAAWLVPRFTEAFEQQMRVQHASDGYRYGEPDDHKIAVQVVVDYLEEHHYRCQKEYEVEYSPHFRVMQGQGCPTGWRYDIAAWHYVIATTAPNLIIEIDGKKHDKKEHKIRDGIAERWIQETFPSCKFIRIKKEDALYRNWLRKKLGI